MDDELSRLVRAAAAAYEAMTPEQKAAHDRAQRESFVRGMMPAGHGMSRASIEARLAKVEAQIAQATCWGAALSELHEERTELKAALRAAR